MDSKLSRRHFLATALAAGAAPNSRPNFLFIMADDLGHADLSCYGRRDYTTPNIDRLAAQGIRFTQAYANACVCSPTRTALITGRWQQRLPVGLEEPLAMSRRDVSPGLPPEHPTLPSLLRNAGYHTALVGKWHLGWRPRFSPLKSGYETFWGYQSGGIDYFTHKSGPPSTDTSDLWDNDTRIEQPGYLTDLLANKAISLLDQYSKSRQPFLLSLHFNAPHWPWEGPGDEAESKTLKSLLHFDGGSTATYTRMMRQLDLQVGRVLQTLARTGLDKNTVVVFTSDNGGERFSDNWPFSGRKAELLEGGIRVPAIVRWPGKIPAGRTTAQVAISMDWMPTFLKLAGVAAAPSHPLDGIDLSPFLLAAAPPIPRKLFWRHRYNSQRAMRDGDMKWLSINGNTFLFNLAQDPMEKANRKDQEPATHARMETEFEAWNRTMLPEDPAAYTYGFPPDELADRYKNQ